MLTWLKATLTTVQEWALLLVSAPLAVWGLLVGVKKLTVILKAAYEGGVFLIDVQDAFAVLKSEMMARLDRIDEGQANQIQARRILMGVDEVKGWFESDPSGNFIWTNRMWREFTGLDSSELKGKGWENGILDSEREEFKDAFADALSNNRDFDRVSTLVNRKGKTQKIRLMCSPIRNTEHENRTLSYLGHFTVVHDRR